MNNEYIYDIPNTYIEIKLIVNILVRICALNENRHTLN